MLDKANLKTGDQTVNPILLIKETVVRGKVIKDNYSFKHEPLGAVVDDKIVNVFYKDTKNKWFKDTFSDDGVFQETNSQTLSEVRNEETLYDIDLDGDDIVGDLIVSELSEVFNNNFKVEYKLLDESNKFSINSETGVISLISPLDYNEKQSYNVVVEAHTTDGRFFNKNLNLNINEEIIFSEEDLTSNEIINNNAPYENINNEVIPENISEENIVSDTEAEPVENDFDKSSLIKFEGSFYEAVTTPKTYNDHKEYAEQQTLYGQKGGLVNINSEAEQQFLYDKFFTLNEKQPSINTNASSDFWYTGMQKNSDGWVYQYTDHTSPIEYTNWAVSNYTHDLSRDIILVSGDSNDGGASRDRGEWIAGHSQAVSQFYSIIEYPVTIENSIVLNNGKIFTFFDLNDPETNSSEIKYEIQELNGEFIQARLNANTITDGNQTNPKILEFDNGSFVVAWLSTNNGKNGIGYQYFDELGEKIDKEKFVDLSVLHQLNQENIRI